MSQKKIIAVIIVFIAVTISFGIIFSGESSRTKNDWKTFTNRADEYSIEYPPNLTPYEHGRTISFQKTQDDHAIFSVTVWNIHEIPPQVLDEKNYKIEKNINIGGYDGIITHARGRTEEYTNEKTLFIRKANKYYIVSGGDIDFNFERLWGSFKI